MASAPIETKVKAATAGVYLSSVAGLGVLEAVHDAPLLIAWLPDWIEPFILGLVPTAITAVAAYQARHTPRTDPAARSAADIRGL